MGSASADKEGQLYYIILYKRLEHLWIFKLSNGKEGALESSSQGYQGTGYMYLSSLYVA